MTNKELFVEYLKFNNLVPPSFTEDDLPSWEIFASELQQPDNMPQPWDSSDWANRNTWNRPNWNRPGWGSPGWNGYSWGGPGFNRPNLAPILWWWLLFN